MNETQVVKALSAVAQETRLRLFRLLVVAGHQGLTPGQMADTLSVTPAALSFHLKELSHAGLVRTQREGRHIVYRAEFATMNQLLVFLSAECCQGQPCAVAQRPADNNAMSDTTIYHNPKCGTSRNTLALIRERGIEPQIIEYLKTPPTRAELLALLQTMGLGVRDILREKESVYGELGLANPALSDAQLLDAIGQHPILMQRPIVKTPLGVRLCRPAEEVLTILPTT